MEEWKDIEGYEGYYQVSSLGEVRSLDRIVQKSDGVKQRRKGKKMPPRLNQDGYAIVKLSKDATTRTIGIHRLVANAFVENPNGYEEVNHLDFDRTNNVATNLEWCSHRDNVKYSSLRGRYKLRDISGTNNPNYGNHTLSQRYKDKNLAKEKMGRLGEQNGHSVRIAMYNQEGFYKEFSWVGACCEYLIKNKICRSTSIEQIRNQILKAIKRNKQYLNYNFKRI